jgi:tRNA-dihydrouridine synthase A
LAVRLSPKQNREIPPLDYGRGHRLKQRFSDRFIGINGGIATLDAAGEQLQVVDGVMIGRAAYQTPAMLAAIDRRFFGSERADRAPVDAVAGFIPYVEAALHRGVRLASITRHMLGLFHGCPGARQWRRILSVDANAPGAGVEVVHAALAAVTTVESADRRSQIRLPAPLPA